MPSKAFPGHHFFNHLQLFQKRVSFRFIPKNLGLSRLARLKPATWTMSDALDSASIAKLRQKEIILSVVRTHRKR